MLLLTFDVGPQTTLTPRARRARPHRDRRELDPHIDDFSNRIRKNHKRLARWARQHDVTCYRVYDADLPDFAFAVDVYQGDATRLHVQEYAPPASVDAQRAQLRRESVLAVLPDLFGVDTVQRRSSKHANENAAARSTRARTTRANSTASKKAVVRCW